MNQESIEEMERQMFASAPAAPGALRDEVLRDVRRELRASTWDRRLARAAVAILLLGVGMTGASGWRGMRNSGDIALRRDMVAAASLAETAVAVAEATDAETGKTVARHIAWLAGREWNDDQEAAIDAAIQKREG